VLTTDWRVFLGLLVKFSGYIEIKAIFEATAKDPTQPLAPWKHMVAIIKLL
jgi:hypothetical protein